MPAKKQSTKSKPAKRVKKDVSSDSEDEQAQVQTKSTAAVRSTRGRKPTQATKISHEDFVLDSDDEKNAVAELDVQASQKSDDSSDAASAQSESDSAADEAESSDNESSQEESKVQSKKSAKPKKPAQAKKPSADDKKKPK